MLTGSRGLGPFMLLMTVLYIISSPSHGTDNTRFTVNSCLGSRFKLWLITSLEQSVPMREANWRGIAKSGTLLATELNNRVSTPGGAKVSIHHHCLQTVLGAHHVACFKCSLLQWENGRSVNVVYVHVDEVRLSLWTTATNRPTVHLPDDTGVWRGNVEWYWQGKPKNSKRIVSQCHFVHKSHTDWTWHEPRPPRWETGK
jgi:hypothetical protein